MKRRIKKVLTAIIAMLILISSNSMLVATAAEYVSEQNKWNNVLSTDLSQYSGQVELMAANTKEVLDTSSKNIKEDKTKKDKDNKKLNAEVKTERFIVKYKNTNKKVETQKKINSKKNIKKVKDIANTDISVVTSVDAVDVETFTASMSVDINNEIEYIQPDYEMFMSAIDEAAIEVLTQPQSAVVSTNQVIVALLDSGIDTSHKALSGSLLAGYDFVNRDNSVNDKDWYYDQSHGTHLAGIIASGGAKVLPLKIFQGGKAYTSDILDAISYAEKAGATIANCSWGSMYYNPALEEAMTKSSMLFVAATGNILANIDKYPTYPAGFDLPNVLSVASVDNTGKLSRFSNYGPNTVDISVCGENVSGPWIEGKTVEISGTSMAAALVSSSAAKLADKFTDYTAERLKDRLVQSADSVSGLIDKIQDGKRMNLVYALSDKSVPNPAVLEINDDEALPEVVPDRKSVV